MHIKTDVLKHIIMYTQGMHFSKKYLEKSLQKYVNTVPPITTITYTNVILNHIKTTISCESV